MSSVITPEVEEIQLKKAMVAFEDGLTQLLDLYLDTRQMLLYADDKDHRQYLEKHLDDLRKDMRFFMQAINDNLAQSQESMLLGHLVTQLMHIISRIASRSVSGRNNNNHHPIWHELPPELVIRLDVLEHKLDQLLSVQEAMRVDVRRGFAILYVKLDHLERKALQDVLTAIQTNRIAIAEMEEILSLIKQTIEAWRKVLPPQDAETVQALSDLHGGIESSLDIAGKLELVIPVVPGFLSFTTEIGIAAETDLRSLEQKVMRMWANLKNRFSQL